MKKRYILLKDSVEYKKGAVFEEMCEDGTQDFRCINKKYTKLPVGSNWTYPRKLVTNQEDWFIELKPVWTRVKFFKKVKEYRNSLTK